MNLPESEQGLHVDYGNDDLVDIKSRIIRALARREHSRYELRVKMTLKSFDSDSVDLVLDEFESENLVSDERFAEAYCYHRKSRGFGPVRVASELKERQVSDKLISEYVDLAEESWFESAVYQREKKFGTNKVGDFTQKAKQMRFLLQKGFTHDQISFAMEKVS